MEELLRVEHLSVDIGTETGTVKAVRDVSFTLGKGETVALVGESGCGKTMMTKSLLRLHDRTNARMSPESRIIFDGMDIGTLSRKELQGLRGSRIAMIFQDSMTSLNPTAPVGKQLEEALRIHTSLDKKERKDEVIRLLRMVEIPDPELRAKSYPHQLSGGMRQRVMIAMALSCKPELLLADEPTTALDVTIQADLLDLLKSLQKELGMSVLLVTHDLDAAVGFADRVMVMYAGRIAESGRTEDLLSHPLHPYTYALLKAMPSGHLKPKSSLYTIKGTPPDLRLPLQCCAFSSRCRYCMGACRKALPPVTDKGGGHIVSCFLQDERAPKVELGAL